MSAAIARPRARAPTYPDHIARLSFPSTASLVSETDSVHASAGGSTHASVNDLDDAELGFSRTPSASTLSAKAAADWLAEHLLGPSSGPLGVLDLPPVDAGEPLAHQRDAAAILERACADNRQTLSHQETAADVLAALAAVLQLLTRAEGSLVVGVEGCGPLLGDRVLEAPIPIFISLPSADAGSRIRSLSDLAMEVGKILGDAIAACGPEPVPLAGLAQRLGGARESRTHHEIFQVLVAFEGPETQGRPDAEPLTRCPRRGCPDAAPLAMVLVVRPAAKGLRFRLTFSQRHLSRSLASAVLSHLCRLLQLHPSMWWKGTGELPLIDDADQDTVLNSWSIGPTESLRSFTKLDGGEHACIHDLFEEQARRAPSARAIVAGDLDAQATALSYAAMDAWATHLALKLRELGVGRGDLVALLFERGPAMIVSIYAVLKAGGCYCPCDAAWPADRLRDVLEGGSPKVAMCPPRLQPQLAAAAQSLPLVPVEEGEAARWASGQLVAPVGGAEKLRGFERPRSGDPCYVFFTSGSTGKPKGVVVEHRGVVHRIRWLQHDYGLCPGDAALLKHAYTFGLSEWEIFWPLAYGASVVACSAGSERDPSYLARLFEFHRVPVSVFVPSALQAFLESVEEGKPAPRGGSGRGAPIGRGGRRPPAAGPRPSFRSRPFRAKSPS